MNTAGEGGRSTEAYATPPSPANQRPMCSIVTPASGDRVSGTYLITGTSGDPDGAVVRVEVRVDNGAWTTAAGTDAWRYNWDTRAASDGSHVVHARSYDGTDYSAEVSVTVTVDNGVPPPRSVFAEGWFYGLLGLVVLVSALLAFILWRERRKKRPPELSP